MSEQPSGHGDTLAEAGHPVRRMPMGTTCAVHRHAAYVPMERHHVHPLGLGGENTAANLITVCCNGHYAIHEYMRQLMLGRGRKPANWRHYGPRVIAYATRGWLAAGSPTSGGGEVT